MLELVRLFLATLLAAAHSRPRLVVENLLLRQQLRSTFCRPSLPAPQPPPPAGAPMDGVMPTAGIVEIPETLTAQGVAGREAVLSPFQQLRDATYAHLRFSQAHAPGPCDIPMETSGDPE